MGGGQSALIRCLEADTVCFESFGRWTPFVGKVPGGGQDVLRRSQGADTICLKSVGRWTRCTEKGSGADTVCWENVGRRTRCTDKVSGSRHRLLGKCWEVDKVH